MPFQYAAQLVLALAEPWIGDASTRGSPCQSLPSIVMGQTRHQKPRFRPHVVQRVLGDQRVLESFRVIAAQTGCSSSLRFCLYQTTGERLRNDRREEKMRRRGHSVFHDPSLCCTVVIQLHSSWKMPSFRFLRRCVLPWAARAPPIAARPSTAAGPVLVPPLPMCPSPYLGGL